MYGSLRKVIFGAARGAKNHRQKPRLQPLFVLASGRLLNSYDGYLA
ncbi:MAG: hypothetical protein BWY63_00126 [Chloroflexi bacterium ADurb.Bin360]|nr:MAG: hypothetical protein BWY63_00126 [Chloroflexi bacterium ADurb.Bin360]